MSRAVFARVAGLLAAFAAVNAMLVFANRWPGLGVRAQWLLSGEAALLLLGLALWSRRGADLGPRVRSALAAVLVFAVIARYADVTSHALLGRSVNLYWDGQHLWQVLRMAGAEQAWGKDLAALAGVVLIVFVLHRLSGLLLGGIIRGLSHPPAASAASAVAAMAMAIWLIGPRVGLPVHRVYAEPVSATVLRQATAMARSLSAEQLESLLPSSPAFDTDLSALGGADVLVLFLEAYGAITFDMPQIAGALAPAREKLGTAIAASGRSVVSARVVSPTFGGASWLAHAALLSGIDTRDPDIYAALLRSRRPSMVSHFAAHGYRTVAWVPGIQRPWPEGRFWRFDRYGELDSMGYAGIPFGYWQVPDQAAMALLARDELRSTRERSGEKPRFVMFPIVSTHAPFVPVAPVKKDWAALTGPGAYTAAERDAALAQPEDWTQPVPQYIGAFRYTLGWLSSFLAERASPDLVLVVIGDHQPIGAVTGPGAPWDVPVHVISRNALLMERLRAEGFVDGQRPAERPLGPMKALTSVLVKAFGAGH